MSKAEERALEAYPIESHEMYDDLYRQRNAYVKGYHQAEKDLELTWEDVVLFRTLFDATDVNIRLGSLRIQPMTKLYYQEVLKRFKAAKEK